MLAVIQDPNVTQALVDERRAKGIDRWDEVWDGVYVIMPNPDDEHQDLVDGLICVLRPYMMRNQLGVARSGANVTDRAARWTQNFRVPDIVVYRADNPARNKGTHWQGGPDLAIEVVSPGDRSLEKLEFYAAVQTREVLRILRDPWRLELYRHNGSDLELVANSGCGGAVIETSSLALKWTLMEGAPRPLLRVESAGTGEVWDI
jgi:Uma2 family endonuclease